MKPSNPSNIIETDEDEDNENKKINLELVRSITSLSLPTTKKEVDYLEFYFKKILIFL